MFEAEDCIGDWTVTGLRTLWALATTLEALQCRSTGGSGALVEGAELPAGSRSEATSDKPVHCVDQTKPQNNDWSIPWIWSSGAPAEPNVVPVLTFLVFDPREVTRSQFWIVCWATI